MLINVWPLLERDRDHPTDVSVDTATADGFLPRG
jgi:hypothetical protein